MADDLTREQQGLATALAKVSENASLLIREEIDLAKTEVISKIERLGRGAGVAVAAGVFAVVGLLFLLHGLAWFISVEVFGGTSYWSGFFVVALMLFLFGAIAGYLAYKWLSKGAPKPTMAIDEAKLIKDTVVKAAEDEGKIK